MEIWSTIPSHPDYSISTEGRILNTQTWNFRKPYLHHSGYYYTCFNRKYYIVARLLAQAFIDNPKNKKEVNHKNGITTDDRLCNLEWVTPSENILHSYYVLKNNLKPIVQEDINGNLIFVWESITAAAKQLKFSAGNICACCKGQKLTAYNFKWKYL